MLKKLGIASIVVAALQLTNTAYADTYTITFDEGTGLAPTQTNGHTPDNSGVILDDEYTGGTLLDLGGVDVQFWAATGYRDGDGEVFNNGVTNPDPSDLNFTDPNFNANLFLTLFNTNLSGTEDPDLEVGQGNVAVVHERNSECFADDDVNAPAGMAGRCYDPDDRFGSGVPHGGFIFIGFSEPVFLHSIDLADMESSFDQRGSFAFYNADTNNILGANTWQDMLYNDTSKLGNGKYGTHEFGSLMLGQTVSYLVMRMQGSGGFKNLSFSTRPDQNVQVSEPMSVALFAFAGGLLMWRRERQSN